MNFKFKHKLQGSFILIFVLYTLAIIFFEYQQNKKDKAEILQSRLDGYTELVHNYIDQNKLSDEALDKIRPIINAMSVNLRVTIIDNDGKVLFDKDVANYSSLENHLDRIEIKGARYQDFGTNTRKSTSTQHEYMYYAKHYSDYFVRVALPYNAATKELLKTDNHLIYTTILLFIVMLMLLYYATTRFSNSIMDLKKLTRMVKDGQKLPKDLKFADDELGDISKELIYILKQKDESKLSIEKEREKLRQHFQYSEEGLAFYNSDFKKVYANTHFIQFANTLVSKPTIDVESIFQDDTFAEITSFIKDKNRSKRNYITQVSKHGKAFAIKTIVFDDNSFEVNIKDITKAEKTRILKQEMTSNIAHELRTPVTSLRGYLETLSDSELTADKQKYFIDKAHLQSMRLSQLIEDIGLLSKIEEQETSFSFDKVNMQQLVDNVRINSNELLVTNNTQLINNIDKDITIKGNYNLLISAIQNLVSNTLNYAGQGVEIHIKCYTQDDNFSYFSYYDTGIGVDEKYMPRLFERFYRIDSGRDRSKGGSGLGLSIVKNIILLHKGDIQVKTHESGGLEFLFKLPK